MLAQSLDSIFNSPPHFILDHISSSDQIEVDNEGNIYLLSNTYQSIYKYLSITRYDSSIFIGGQSQREEGLSNPVKISSDNRQSLYVLDDVARRIILLNTNFQLIREMDFLELNTSIDRFIDQQDVFPQSFCLNLAGEIFVLNQLDNRISKTNVFGEIEISFGGTDYGEGSLYHPVDIQASSDNFVFVSDTSSQQLMVYNNFGIFQYSIKPETSIRWKAFHLFEKFLICFNEHSMSIHYLIDQSSKEFHFPDTKPVKDLYINRQFIYLLQENAVLLYNFKE